MRKQLQNKIAESGLTLPVVAVYSFAVWLLEGLVEEHWWAQLACLATSAYLMVEMSNSNALLRVRSRMVSSVFLMLSTAGCFMFGSLSGGIAQLCFIATLSILFRTYQDKQTQGWAFYAFLCLSLASLVNVHILYLVPLLWLLMVTQLQSLGWRSWFASIIGLLTPYWFAAAWVLYKQDFALISAHFTPLSKFTFPYNYSELTISQLALFGFTVIVMLLGAIHFWNKSFEDKIRIRQLYGFFFIAGMMGVLLLALQPQHYDLLMRLIIVCASPLIAHFFVHTSTRFTNIVFCTSGVLVVLLTIANLLAPYWSAIHSLLLSSWNGLLNF